MSTVISIASGKGGVGKTTIAAAILAEAARWGMQALGVDADAQQSLNYLATRAARASLYQQLDERARQARQGGMPRQEYEAALASSLVHTSAGYDLLTMGRPSGEGCYCAANAAVKKLVFGAADAPGLAARYDLVVVDCEAGPEKVARRMLTPGSTALIVANLDPQGMSIHVADGLAVAIAQELPGVRVVRLLSRVPEGGDMATLPHAWQDVYRASEGLDQLQLQVTGLLDWLLARLYRWRF